MQGFCKDDLLEDNNSQDCEELYNWLIDTAEKVLSNIWNFINFS